MSAPSALAVRRARAEAAQREAEQHDPGCLGADDAASSATSASSPSTASPGPLRKIRSKDAAIDADKTPRREKRTKVATETPPDVLFKLPDPSASTWTTSSVVPVFIPSERHNMVLHDGVLTCGLRSEALVVRGTFAVHVLRGCISVGGATLTPSSAPLHAYAPEVYPAVDIRAVNTDEAVEDAGSSAALETDCSHLQPFSTIVRLTSQRTGLENLAHVCPLAGPDPCATHRALPGCTFALEDDALDTLHMPDEWHATSKELVANAGVILLRGAKNTGKSTFARLLLNALLMSHPLVGFLDLDLGQPEFGPPGLVALHMFDAAQGTSIAPGWCGARLPVRAHFVGDVSPRDDPARYVAAAADLASCFVAEWQHQRRGAPVPLVVNTHGWIKGLGLGLLERITVLLAPTHVVDLGALPIPGATLTLVPWSETRDGRADAASRRRCINAAEARTLSLLAYFHAVRLPMLGAPTRPAWDFTPLVARRPWVVDVAEGLAGGLTVLDAGAPVDEELRLMALNGAVVALVQRSGFQATGDSPDDIWRAALAHGEVAEDARPAPALGLAVVRSIDRARGAVLLLTPVPAAHLAAQVDVGCAPLGLVKGALDLPMWAALDAEAYADVMQPRPVAPDSRLAGVPRSAVPYVAWPSELIAGSGAAEPLGARPRKVRRNLMRRGQRT